MNVTLGKKSVSAVATYKLFSFDFIDNPRQRKKVVVRSSNGKSTKADEIVW